MPVRKTLENQRLAKTLRRALSFPIFLPMDAIPQEFGNASGNVRGCRSTRRGEVLECRTAYVGSTLNRSVFIQWMWAKQHSL